MQKKTDVSTTSISRIIPDLVELNSVRPTRGSAEIHCDFPKKSTKKVKIGPTRSKNQRIKGKVPLVI